MTLDQRTGHAPCPDVEELSALLDGALDDARAVEVDAHVATCATCSKLRWRLEQAATLVQGLPRETASEDLVRRVASAASPARRARFGPGAWALAAAAGGLVGVVLLFRLVGAQREMAPEPAWREARSAAKVDAPAAAPIPPMPAQQPSSGMRAEDAEHANLDASLAVPEAKAAAENSVAKDDSLGDKKRADGAATLAPVDALQAAGGKEEQLAAAKPAAAPPSAPPPPAEAEADAGFATGGVATTRFGQSPEGVQEAAASEPANAAAQAGLARNERAKTAPADAPARSRSTTSRDAGLAKLGEVAPSAAIGDARGPDADDETSFARRQQEPHDRCDVLLALISGGSVIDADSPAVTAPRLLTPAQLDVPARWLASHASASVRAQVLVEADGSARACELTLVGVLPEMRADVERRARELVATWRYEPARESDRVVASVFSQAIPVTAIP